MKELYIGRMQQQAYFLMVDMTVNFSVSVLLCLKILLTSVHVICE